MKNERLITLTNGEVTRQKPPRQTRIDQSFCLMIFFFLTMALTKIFENIKSLFSAKNYRPMYLAEPNEMT